tara:strand:- start:4141 stop:4809 length:669 start_codon:yes stop_codon:yes gene_type:complete
MKNYIKNKNKNTFYVEKIRVTIKDTTKRLPVSDIKFAIEKSLSKIPSNLLTNVKEIQVGNFSFLKDRSLDAMYKSSRIYLGVHHKKAEQMIDDIVHEVAHSVEDVYQEQIYGDKKIENEFIKKRKKMWELLRARDFNVDIKSFLNVSYDRAFDEMLYKNLGYPLLSVITTGLFYSPYASTSLREYFANGFEAFFMKEKVNELKKISPSLYEKMIFLLDKKGE